MHKILIIGPHYYNYLSAVEYAFKTLGWIAIVEGYDDPIHPYTPVMKCRYKLCGHKEKLQTISRAKYKHYIEQRFQEEQPDLVFIINGNILFTETLDYFRQYSKVACWFFDRKDNIPNSQDRISHVDALFCYDQEDVNEYKRQGKTAYFLPQACDSQVYYPISYDKDIDILFVGNLYRSPKRMQYIQAVIKAFPHNKIKIIGEYKPYYKNPIKWLFREHRNIYYNKNLPSKEINNLYNRSKVVLNIHNEQQHLGANPKVFEISGSGAFQICDANPYIEHLFPHQEIAFYHSVNELLEKIRISLTLNCANGHEAYRIIKEKHTFEQRIRIVLQTLSLPS